MKHSLLLAFCLLVLLQGKALGQDASFSRTNFPGYITNQPWVDTMTFEMSMPTNGFTLRKASLQPGGFYYQDLANPPYRKLYTFGESTDEYWQTTPMDIDVAKKNRVLGGTLSNRLEVMCLVSRRDISSLLNLGINNLDNQKITWVSPNEFASPFLNWIGQPSPGKIDVKILSYYQNLPREIEYDVFGPVRRHFDITCKYARPVLPPSEEDITETGKGWVLSFTNK